MNFSKVSYTEVLSMAEQLHSSSGSMADLLTEIKALFDKIGTEEVWSGTAASATKETFDQLSGRFNDFSKSVDDCYTYLKSVVENYKAVDAMVSGNQ